MNEQDKQLFREWIIHNFDFQMPEHKIEILIKHIDHYFLSRSGGVWVKAETKLPEIIDKKCKPRFVKVEKKKYKSEKTYTIKAVAYYFPEHFKTVEWEDWDDYSEENFPYTENDAEKGVVWLRPGWYESINCDNCEEYWSSPLKVIEWLDESPAADKGDAIDGWISVDDEKKPGDGEFVHVCLNGNSIGVDSYLYHNGKWWPFHHPVEDKRVTHWQPLPQPPQSK